MDIAFARTSIERLYYEEKIPKNCPVEVVDAFFEVMSYVEAAEDERELRAMRSLHYEKLKGDRKNEHSLRLWKGWRLTFRIENKDGKIFLVLDVVDYHRG